MSAGIRSGQTRASGERASEEEARDQSEAMTEPIESEVLPEERERSFRTPGFSRMRTDWRSEDRTVIQAARAAVDGRVLANFADAYQVMHEVYDLVRTPLVDEATGEIRTDQWGFPLWKQTTSGSYEEDWTRLTLKQKENLLFSITTRLFEWEQRSADAWGEAMFAKAMFEERFAIAFDAPMSGTVDDRKAQGNIEAREERYFAIFLTLYSRKTEAIVRTLALLGQRLKDSMQ
jgi:hypothetical protein